MQVRPSSVPPKSILKNGPLYQAQSQAGSPSSLFGSFSSGRQAQSPFPIANFAPTQRPTPSFLSQSANNSLNPLYPPFTTSSNMSAVSFAPSHGSISAPLDPFAPRALSSSMPFAMPSTPSTASDNAYSTFSLPQPSDSMYKDPTTTTATTADQTARQAAVRAMLDSSRPVLTHRVLAGPDGRTDTVSRPLDVRAIAELLGARGADGKRFTTGATRTATESTPSTGSKLNPWNWFSRRSSAASGTGTRPTEEEEKAAARQTVLPLTDTEDLLKLAYQTGAEDGAKSQGM